MSPSLEVVMRPPEVFVRELSLEEGARLKSISKRARYQSKRQRAMIVLASSTGMPAPQIAAVVRTDESHVRKVIHAFNDRGFVSLDPPSLPSSCETASAVRSLSLRARSEVLSCRSFPQGRCRRSRSWWWRMPPVEETREP